MPLSIVLARLRFVGVEQTPAPEPAQHSQLDRMPYRLQIGAVRDGQLMKYDARRCLALTAAAWLRRREARPCSLRCARAGALTRRAFART